MQLTALFSASQSGLRLPRKSRVTTLEQTIGNTPLIKLQRLAPAGSEIWLKMEGNNPAGSVKDRAAYSMIHQAEQYRHCAGDDCRHERLSPAAVDA
jgi:cysteine synthase B